MSFPSSLSLSGTFQNTVPGRRWWGPLLQRWTGRQRHRDGRRLQRIQDEYVRSLLASHAGVRMVAISTPQGERLSSATGNAERMGVDPSAVGEECEEAARQLIAHWLAGHGASSLLPSVIGNALCRRVDAGDSQVVMLIVFDPQVRAAHAAWLGRYAAKELRSRMTHTQELA